MKKLAVRLTNFVIGKGMAEESARDVYEYGFQTAAEAVLSLAISILIASAMNMPVEGVFFFLIFIPIRTYAGGFHLEHYWSCLLMSCITFYGVLFFVKYMEVPILVSLILSGILVGAIWLLYPVEHINRPVDVEENKYFKQRIGVILVFDAILGLVFLFFRSEEYLLLMVMTLMVVVLAMVLGKIRYKKTNQI